MSNSDNFATCARRGCFVFWCVNINSTFHGVAGDWRDGLVRRADVQRSTMFGGKSRGSGQSDGQGTVPVRNGLYGPVNIGSVRSNEHPVTALLTSLHVNVLCPIDTEAMLYCHSCCCCKEIESERTSSHHCWNNQSKNWFGGRKRYIKFTLFQKLWKTRNLAITNIARVGDVYATSY